MKKQNKATIKKKNYAGTLTDPLNKQDLKIHQLEEFESYLNLNAYKMDEKE